MQKFAPFSVLMSVYSGDTLTQLRAAVTSNTLDQELAPQQMVIVRDGAVSEDIQHFLDELKTSQLQALTTQTHPLDATLQTTQFTIVELDHNSGLAHALNVGLQHCNYDIVARADSDDISLPQRFALQIPLLTTTADNGSISNNAQYDIVGTAIQEFTQGEDGDIARGQIRVLPESGAQLAHFARMQSPLHHPSVAFRKQAILDVHGYPEHSGRFEDYLLWERLILSGYTLYNIPQTLVLYRVDAGAYQRRGGTAMFASEMKLQRQFLRDRFITPVQYMRNICIRALYRLIPTSLRTWAYRVLVALR